jgi:chaperonin GroES
MNASITVSQLKPTPGYVLVEPQEQKNQTDSGIYLPDSHEEKPQAGRVLAVGDETVTENGKTIKSPAKKDDVVFYKKWGGNDVKIGFKEYQFLKFEDILATVQK